MSLNDKGIESALRMPFDFLGGVFHSLINIFVDLFLLPIRMIGALFD